MQKKNDLTTLLFLLIGLVAVVDLVFVQLRQQANEKQADQQLACIADVVSGARTTIEYNGRRDAALKVWALNPTDQNREALRQVIATAPAPLPGCEIDWK